MDKWIRCLVLGVGLCAVIPVSADTVDRYMRIADNIPKMTMKADIDSQTWARSARNILRLTTETIAETLQLANESATQQGKPLFCLPSGKVLNAQMVNAVVKSTYRKVLVNRVDRDSMTVSQVALVGLVEKYPCSSVPTKQAWVRPASPTINPWAKAVAKQRSSMGIQTVSRVQ